MKTPEIDLISDTVTRPTEEMLEAMMEAKVGDDVFDEDPTIQLLQDYLARLFGKGAALFCPSGTMTNQIALKLNTSPLDEILCDKQAHIYNYEVGGFAFHSGCSIQLLEGTDGIFTAEQVRAAIKPDYDWLPDSRLVVIENSCNKAGGNYWTLDDADAVREVCENFNLKMHLDGARLFNVLAETGDSPEEWGTRFDTVSICLSKGLGAPVGSVLIGSKNAIARARKIRKVMGGGMRQAGLLAAAGLYALEHHVERLKIDNERARLIGETLIERPYVSAIRPVKTNIVIFDLLDPLTSERFLEELSKRGIRASAFGPSTVRMVTHLDIDVHQIERVRETLVDLDDVLTP